MGNSRKNKIADALEELLQENSISKITVSDVVTASGVSRQTFYNNFTDIYDLIYWAHMKCVREAVSRFWENEDFCLAFEMAGDSMRQHKAFYKQVVKKEGINSFQYLFAKQNIELSKVHIKKVSDVKIDKNIDFLLELYWYGAAQMLVNWIVGGMKEEPKVLARLLYEGLPQALRIYWASPKV